MQAAPHTVGVEVLGVDRRAGPAAVQRSAIGIAEADVGLKRSGLAPLGNIWASISTGKDPRNPHMNLKPARRWPQFLCSIPNRFH